ncbi:MAG: flagellar basal-body MS-ring/collar protein FliF, partial [Pseudomonadota bacterium]
PEDVAVVDQEGDLLSSRDADPSLERSERQLAYVDRVESHLQDKVASLLTTVAGPDRFRAEVNATMDFTDSEQTRESYDPERRALRSEQSLEESRQLEKLMEGVPGALSNQPPAPAQAPETAEQEEETAAGAGQPEQTRVRATRNFEVDRTISHTRHQVGRLERLAVSVVLDDARPAEGEDASGWTDEELAEISSLVQTAVGYRADRGDVVTVASSPFLVTEPEPVEPAPFWTETWFLELSKQVLGALIVLLIVVMLLRPLFKSVSKAGENLRTQQHLALASRQGQVSGSRTGDDALPAPADDGQKLEAVRGMVAEKPETVARVVRQWTLANE